jgi:prophage regulatory protein
MNHGIPVMTNPNPYDDRFIREPEVRRMTGLSRATRWRLERKGRFPRRRQISANAVGWLLSEVRDWCASRQIIGDDQGQARQAIQ